MSEWHPNLDTENSIDLLLNTMLREFPHLLGIDESIPNCEVINMDPDGTSPAVPRPIIVRINTYYQTVIYRGFPSGLLAGDYVTVLHMAKGDTYEIFGAGGAAGYIPSGDGVGTPPHFSSEEILLNLTFDHLKVSQYADEESDDYFAPVFYYLTSRRDRAWLWPGSTSFNNRCPHSRPPSLWRFRRAFQPLKSGTNLVTNPSFEVDTTGWTFTNCTGTRVMLHSWSQVWSLKCTASAQNGNAYFNVTAPATTNYSFSAWIKATSNQVRLRCGNVTTADWHQVDHPGDGQWHRLVINNVPATIGDTLRLRLRDDRAAGWDDYYADAIQIEATAYHTPYIDGDQGDGLFWNGTNHASTSSRAYGYVNLVDMVSTISDRDSYSVRCVVQAPYDADFAYWPYDPSPIWDARGANDNNRITLRYNATTDQFNVFINGAVLLQSSTQTFTEGEWFDIVIKFNFGLYDSFELWINGVQEDTFGSLYGLTAPTLTGWQLGADITTIDREAGWIFAEYTVYESDTLLTETLIEQLYLTGPTIDPDGVLEDRITPPAFWDHLVTDAGSGGSGAAWSEFVLGRRFLLSGDWADGWWHLEVNAESNAEPNDAEIKLQYYDEILAAWYDVPGSLIVITTIAMDRYLSYPLSLIRSMHEFRVVRRQPSEITTYTYKVRVFNSYGGDVTL